MKRHLHLKWSATPSQTFVVNLDPYFTPLTPSDESQFFELGIKQSTFLGGEPYLRFVDEVFENIDNAKMVVTQRADTVEDFFRVILAADAARRLGFNDISLILPYFPGARQDRVCNDGESLTVKVYADMINRCGFSSVHILTPHSDVTPALIDNVVLIDDLQFAEKTIRRIAKDYKTKSFKIICPDAGAGKRVEKIVKYLKSKLSLTEKYVFEIVNCEKVRDLATGELQSFRVNASPGDFDGFVSVIFDDIVSMGGTFVGLEKKLSELGAENIFLSVSHADCYAGLKKMCDTFEAVFITDSRRVFTADPADLLNLTVWPIKL
jgi:ribose-phosphate pyrophosphokinase